MAKLLGMQVKTPGVERFHTVWAGQTEEKREDHKTFILENCAPRNEDGTPNCYFVHVESEVTITATGTYLTEEPDSYFRVERICDDGIRCYGYLQKRNKHGRLADRSLRWYYINGHACLDRYPKLTELAKPAELQPVAPGTM